MIELREEAIEAAERDVVDEACRPEAFEFEPLGRVYIKEGEGRKDIREGVEEVANRKSDSRGSSSWGVIGYEPSSADKPLLVVGARDVR